MLLEHPAVEVRHIADEPLDLSGSLLLGKTVVEQREQERAVERVEAVLAEILADSTHPVAEVVGVPVEQPSLLDEVDQHEPVEHERAVPLAVGTLLVPGGTGNIWNALDRLDKGVLLLLEAVVELLGDGVGIEGVLGPTRDLHQVRPPFLLICDAEGDAGDSGEQLLARSIVAPHILAVHHRAASLPPDPSPPLHPTGLVGNDRQVLPESLADLPIQCRASDLVGYLALVGDDGELALFADHPEGILLLLGGDGEALVVAVPTQLLDEEPLDVEGGEERTA